MAKWLPCLTDDNSLMITEDNLEQMRTKGWLIGYIYRQPFAERLALLRHDFPSSFQSLKEVRLDVIALEVLDRVGVLLNVRVTDTLTINIFTERACPESIRQKCQEAYDRVLSILDEEWTTMEKLSYWYL